MKLDELNYFDVIFSLRERSRPPLAVFRIFRRGQWIRRAEAFYQVNVPGATPQSLKAELSASLRTGELVRVHRSAKQTGARGHLERPSWESRYQIHLARKQRQKNSRALSRIVSGKPPKMRPVEPR